MAKRAEVCKKVYILEDDTEARSASDKVVRQEFRFANGAVHSIGIADFPEYVRGCALLHGFSQKLGDKFAGAKGDANAAEQVFLSQLEQLQVGNWVTKAGAGLPRITIVLEAIIRAYKAKGDPMSAERIAKAKEDLKDREILEGAKDDEPIAAQIKVINREHAEAAEAKALEKAEGVEIKSKF